MKQGGYTLLEAIVAIGIFSIVSIMAIGATITMLSAYNRTQATQVVVDSLNFSIEAMTRDIRFGENYSSGGGSISVDFKITDPAPRTERITYSLGNDGRLYRQVDGARIAITPDSVDINKFQVYVNNSLHPRATFVIEGVFDFGQRQTDFSLQTTVSQRAPKRP